MTTKSFLWFIIIIERVVYIFNMKVLILTVVWREYDSGIFWKWLGGLKLPFSVDELCHSRRGNLAKLTWSTPPFIMSFCATFYLIVGEYHNLMGEARLLELISQMVYLYLPKNEKILVIIISYLLSTNSLYCVSRALCSPNYFLL